MKRPSPLRSVMAKGTSVPKNKYDTKEFRSTLVEGRGGNWHTPEGDAFVDGTHNPKTQKKTQSTVVKMSPQTRGFTKAADMYSRFLPRKK